MLDLSIFLPKSLHYPHKHSKVNLERVFIDMDNVLEDSTM